MLQALKKMRDDGKDISGILYGICGDGFFHDRMEEWIRRWIFRTMWSCSAIVWMSGRFWDAPMPPFSLLTEKEWNGGA